MSVTAHDIYADDGTRIRLWERSQAESDEAVLFVHGATYGGRGVFDVDAPDIETSWLRTVAEDGPAAFAIDIRGYGDSERPLELEGPSEAHPSVVRAPIAADDVTAALEFIVDRVNHVHLVGYSWGTIVCGILFRREIDVEIRSLTQFAPIYDPPSEFQSKFDPGTPPSAYRTTTKAQIEQRWKDQLLNSPDSYRGGSRDSDVLDAFWSMLHNSGQRVEGEPTDTILAPNGALSDISDAATGGPLYAGADIVPPTLVIRGSLDTISIRMDALNLYDALPEGRFSEYVEIAGGTHFLQLENRRDALYDTVARFQRRSSQ